jgi:hypothetical protein
MGAIANYIANLPEGTSYIAVISGVITIIIGFLNKPEAGNTPAGMAEGNWLERAYWWFWFHTEFWIANKLKRRPYTFMMRDFWHRHEFWGWLIFAAVTGLIVWGVYWSLWFLILFAFHWALFAHLRWGSKYIQGEQEEPEYTGGRIEQTNGKIFTKKEIGDIAARRLNEVQQRRPQN